ncbi:MAG: hypothetical protein IKM59_02970 [Oscillospiraceae bacterium]|nr:hypothetical protein [Oscillospiraceae bacterium]
MTEKQKIIALLIGAVITMLIPLCRGIYRMIAYRYRPIGKGKPGISGLVLFSLCLLIGIWLMRYAVGYYEILTFVPGSEEESLPAGKEFLNSFFAALRTISLEEEYKDYIQRIGTMAKDVFPCSVMLQGFLSLYASFLNLLAPLAGGAIVLDILARCFPRVKLWFCRCMPWREKFYFSELNEESVSLAKSLLWHYARELKRARPILVFTDVLIDDEEEKEYELLQEAKRIGGICLRDDLAHAPKFRWGKRKYFLIDRKEFGNMQTLVDLTESGKACFIKRANIYLFVETDAYVQLETKIRASLKTHGGKRKALGEEEIPVIMPVRGYQNLVQNLFSDVPLYEPLIGRQDLTELKVSILGSGLIGTEAFLNAYWMGQLLVSKENGAIAPCKLTIHVMSKETPEEFWAKIDYVNPEIRKTVEETAESETGKKDKITPSYCSVSYSRIDVKIGSFWDSNAETNRCLVESDYIIIALGSDENNMSVAERMRLFIGRQRLEEHGEKKHTVIAYAVFHSELCRALNRDVQKDSGQEQTAEEALAQKARDNGIRMHAFGSREQVYSAYNIFMSESEALAKETGSAYRKARNSDAHILAHKDRTVDENSNYNYWANISRALHTKYKVFSLGWITSSFFDVEEKGGENAHREEVARTCETFRRIASLRNKKILTPEDRKLWEELEKKSQALAWLEHRRWCAFTRVMGYRSTDAIEENLRTLKTHKNMSLKLHPCLVEADWPSNGRLYMKDMLLPGGDLDALDRVSLTCREIACSLGLEKPENFKKYDYYFRAFEHCVLRTQLELWNQGDEKYKALLGTDFVYPKGRDKNATAPVLPQLYGKKLNRLCKKGKEEGLVKDYGSRGKPDVILPVSYLQEALGKDLKLLNKKQKDHESIIEACKDGRIPDAIKFGGIWFLPKKVYKEWKSARKPEQKTKPEKKEKVHS